MGCQGAGESPATPIGKPCNDSEQPSALLEGEPADQQQATHAVEYAAPGSYQLHKYANSAVREDPFVAGQRLHSVNAVLIGELDAMLSSFMERADRLQCEPERSS
jgi:hypothetical protein